jgi:selenocysteine lyase/cysteine desulfurase
MTDLTRRTFLARSSVLAGGLAVGVGCTGSDDDSEAGNSGNGVGPADDAAAGGSGGEPFDPSDSGSVRDQFPLTTDDAHFEAFVLASHPRPVAAAIERHRAGLDDDTERYLAANEEKAEGAVRTAAAEYLGAQPTEVALTDSTTMGLGLLYAGLRVRPGQQVLTTEHDFYSTHQAWALRSAHDGVTMQRVALYDDPAAATADDGVSRLMAGVTPATRAVAITWVHSSTA